MTVSWYQCTCGFVTEAAPRFGDSITSVSHLHRATRLDGTSSIVRMDEISGPVLKCEVGLPGRERRGARSVDGGRRAVARSAGR
jgi:hypothetical protein